MAEVVIVKSREEASSLAAQKVLHHILAKPDHNLGVATGETPLALYRQMAFYSREYGIGVGGVTAFALDEYLGLGPESPQSFHHALLEHFVQVLDLETSCLRVPNSSTKASGNFGAAFEEEIKEAGGIDCQILGIGTNGHIGFNEPGSSLASRTRITMLTDETRRDNASYFSGLDDVPRHSISQGIGTILEARHLVLLAFGPRKAPAVAAALEGPVTSSCPASAIQLHSSVTVFLDRESSNDLARRDYYIQSLRNQPEPPSWRFATQFGEPSVEDFG